MRTFRVDVLRAAGALRADSRGEAIVEALDPLDDELRVVQRQGTKVGGLERVGHRVAGAAARRVARVAYLCVRG